MQLALLAWSGASRTQAQQIGQAQLTRQTSIHKRPPTPRCIFSPRSVSAGQTTAELPLCCGLLPGTVLSNLPLLSMQSLHPDVGRAAARVGEYRAVEYFPFFLTISSVLAIIIISVSRLCGTCVTQRKLTSSNWIGGLSRKAYDPVI